MCNPVIFVLMYTFLLCIFFIIFYHGHRQTQCIPLIENYGQGLGRKERRQLIPIEETVTKESLDSKKVFKERETCNLQNE